jgi:hypothetical protein
MEKTKFDTRDAVREAMTPPPKPLPATGQAAPLQLMFQYGNGGQCVMGFGGTMSFIAFDTPETCAAYLRKTADDLLRDCANIDSQRAANSEAA